MSREETLVHIDNLQLQAGDQLLKISNEPLPSHIQPLKFPGPSRGSILLTDGIIYRQDNVKPKSTNHILNKYAQQDGLATIY